MTNYIVYGTPGTCARVTMIAMEEAGIPFEARLVRIMIGEQRSPEYLALNPKGKVPLLLVDGTPMTENVAILLHLAEKFPDAGLLPETDEGGRSSAIEDMCFCASTLHPIVTRIALPHFFVDGEEAQKSLRQKAIDAMLPNVALVEKRLQQGDWWYGDRWSALDAYFFWVWSRIASNGFPVQDFAACVEHTKKMEDHPSVRRALAREGAMVQQLKAEGLPFGPPPTGR